MNPKTVAALFALVALPVAAQNATPRAEPRQAPAQAAESKTTPNAGAAKKERTRLAKQDCAGQPSRRKQDRPKKAKAAS